MPGTITRNATGPFVSQPFLIPPGHSLALSLSGTGFSAVLEGTLDIDSPDWVTVGPTFTVSALYNVPVGPLKFRLNLASGTIVSAQYSSSLIQVVQATTGASAGPDYSGAIAAAQTTANSAQGQATIALGAISYPSKAALSADMLLPNGIRAFVGDSMWDWSATGVVDGGRVIAGANGGYRIRSDLGGARPEWYGAKGDGVTDDTNALSACINNHPLTLLRYGATYRVRAPISAYNVCRVVAEGVILRQLSGFPDDAAVSTSRSARILWDPITLPTYDTGCLTLLRSGSEILDVEIYFVQPVDRAGWVPNETGWAVDVKAPWCKVSGMIRGFRYGIRGGRFTTIECAALHIPYLYDGTYDIGIYIEQASDVVRIDRVHSTIWAEPNNFADQNRIRYQLLNKQAIKLRRSDNAELGQIFVLFCNTALLLDGPAPKTQAVKIEADECLYAVRISGVADLDVGQLTYQRFPENAPGPYGNLITGTDAGRAIETYAGASGTVTVGIARLKNTRSGMVYLDGAVDMQIAAGRVENWGIKAGNTEAAYVVANASSALSVGEVVKTTVSATAPIYALTTGAVLRVTASGTQTPGSPTIAAGATYDFGLVAPGSQPGMTVSIGTSGFINDGITAQAIIAAAGTVTVRLRNNTAAPIVLTALTWRVVCKS